MGEQGFLKGCLDGFVYGVLTACILAAWVIAYLEAVHG